MYPNFIVIGAAKCGTTSLCDLLGSHPDIFFSSPKEPRYFSDMKRYGSEELRREYEALFDDVGGERLVGEGTTTYTHPEICSQVAERISTAIPHCKLIFMARHPVRRLESDWRMRYYEGWAPPDINDAVDDNPSLITHSLFARNLRPYMERFGRERIHVMLLEDLARSPETTLRRCLEFLGADPSAELDDPTRRRNASREFRRDSRLSARLRQSSALTRVRDLLPTGVTRMVKRLLTREIPYEPHWNADSLQRVHTALRDDAREFLGLAGKPPDFWDIGPGPDSGASQ